MSPAGQDDDAAIRLRHDRSEMQRLSDWIDGRVAALALSDDGAHAVRLCLEEAVLNIIAHNPAPADPAAVIRVSLDRSDGRVAVRVEDRCAPFDPLAVPAQAQPANLADAPIGGMGIPLMRHFASAMEYRRDGGANRLVLLFDA
jgi:serine/threonine-protein kinase RsbW